MRPANKVMCPWGQAIPHTGPSCLSKASCVNSLNVLSGGSQLPSLVHAGLAVVVVVLLTWPCCPLCPLNQVDSVTIINACSSNRGITEVSVHFHASMQQLSGAGSAAADVNTCEEHQKSSCSCFNSCTVFLAELTEVA